MSKTTNTLFLSLLTATISTSAFAKPGFYIGGNIPVANENYISPLGVKIDATNRLNFEFIGGYEFAISEKFGLGLEAQYSSVGEYKYKDISTSKADAFFISAKPKYYIADSNFYIGGMFGIGDVALDVKNHHFDFGVKNDAVGYQIGVEAGYQIDNLDVAFGLKDISSKIQNVDVRSSGPFVGIRYNF
ncbi:outer membrane beta-barrel protein [Vibrio maritimus]|uniref:outer membrane beta-barrel protein n=1 Tax=Vibrio maritimus TaxID=990268 RepID=UPI001F15B2DE|nr:outer membrane beta-barrel protein [Vibrio maritimus]